MNQTLVENTPQKPIQINLTQSTVNNTETKRKRKIKRNSILIMFTWRDLQLKKQISFDYFKNFVEHMTHIDPETAHEQHIVEF